MTSSTPEFDEVPAEDWVEQDLDADPLSASEDAPGPSARDVDVLDLEADEADLVEQETDAYTADDEER